MATLAACEGPGDPSLVEDAGSGHVIEDLTLQLTDEGLAYARVVADSARMDEGGLVLWSVRVEMDSRGVTIEAGRATRSLWSSTLTLDEGVTLRVGSLAVEAESIELQGANGRIVGRGGSRIGESGRTESFVLEPPYRQLRPVEAPVPAGGAAP